MYDLPSIQNGLLDYLRDRAVLPRTADEMTDLIDSGILDSLLLVDLVLQIQTAFDVELRSADVTPGNFRSIAQLARLVQQRLPTNRSNAA